jgi:RimJ/RimL family protein N-acetyltransferase
MGTVELRPVREGDLAALLRFLVDPSAPGEFEWFGFRAAQAKIVERRWNEDGLMGEDESYLAVTVRDDMLAGWVNWRPKWRGLTAEIGIVLFPEHRGHGVGTEAQQLLVHYLFCHTGLHRLEARTEVGNLAEQRALEKVGFLREGVARGTHLRDGEWRDSVGYGLVRDDPR